MTRHDGGKSKARSTRTYNAPVNLQPGATLLHYRITALASSTVLVDYPSWSPDGETVYFSLARKRGDLYLIEQ